MKVFGNPRSFEPGPFLIDNFHRAGLGLETDTTVFLAPVPLVNAESPDRPSNFPGLLISTLDPGKWKSLWRLSVTLEEQSGIVAQLLEALRTHANISVLETLTTETSRFHEVYAIVDLTSWGESLENPERVSEQLCKKIRAAALETEAPLTIMNNSIQAAPLERLRRAFQDRATCGLNSERGYLQRKVIGGQLVIEGGDLLNLLRKAQPELRPHDVPTRILLFSDTEEKYLSCYFPGLGQSLLRFSVVHKDEPGAIATFTKIVARHKANILNSYSRLQEMGERAEWRAILDITRTPSCRALVESFTDVATEKLAQSSRFFMGINDLQMFPSSKTPPEPREMGPNPFNEADAVKLKGNFFGRKALLQSISNSISSGNILITGFSKSGKTSVLRQARVRLSKERNLTVIRGVSFGTGEDFWWELAREVASQICATDADSDLKKICSDCTERLGKVNITSEGASGVAFSRDTTGEKERVALDTLKEINDWLEEHSHLERIEKLLVVVLDEAQMPLGRSEDRLYDIWLYLLNRCHNLRWLVAASIKEAPTLPAELLAKFVHETLGPLEVGEARALATSSFREAGVLIYEEAVKDVLYTTGCHPAYLQAICRELWQLADARSHPLDVLTRSDTKKATKAAIRKLGSHFSRQFYALKKFLSEDLLLEELLRLGKPVAYHDAFIAGAERFPLEGFPGLLTHSENEGNLVAAVDIFRTWAKENGLFSGKLGTVDTMSRMGLGPEIEKAFI